MPSPLPFDRPARPPAPLGPRMEPEHDLRPPLPLPLTPLVGRAREVTTATALLREDARLVTLTGPGGVGKTRLALHVAADLLADFGGAVFFIELAPIADPDLVGSAIAHVLDVPKTDDRPPLDALKAALRDTHALLVLDNAEHLLEAGPVFAELLAACPAVKAVVTSRARLRLRGEHEVGVPPLALPDLRPLPPLADLSQVEAVRLFVARVREVEPSFALTEDNAATVAEICHRLDGLPLALELAAARSKVLSSSALLARLTDRLQFLTGGPRDLPARLQTMRDAIAWSYDLLSPEQQALFRGLAVFTGGFTLDAAEAVVSNRRPVAGARPHDPGPHHPAPLVFDNVASLVDASLLRQEVTADDARFAMLDTIREYALGELEARDEAQDMRYAHAAHFLTLVERAEPELMGAEQGGWLSRLETEHPNLRAALAWALEAGQAELALRLGAALWRFWWLRGHLSEGRRWLDRALAATSEARSPARVKALSGAGGLAVVQGDYRQGGALKEASLELARELGDRQAEARGLSDLATIAAFQGDLARAVALTEEALELFRDLEDKPGTAASLNNLGNLARHQGDLPAAEGILMGALALSQDLGDRSLTAAVLGSLGNVARADGDVARAIGRFQEALALASDVGDKAAIAESLRALASLTQAAGQPRRAGRLFGAAEALRQAIGAELEPTDAASYEGSAAAAREAIGEIAFTAAWQEGRQLPLVQSVKDALDPRLIPPMRQRAGCASDIVQLLTPREVEVLRLLVEGRSDREIADALYISPHTAMTHVKHILRKLDVDSRTAAATTAVRRGLV